MISPGRDVGTRARFIRSESLDTDWAKSDYRPLEFAIVAHSRGRSRFLRVLRRNESEKSRTGLCKNCTRLRQHLIKLVFRSNPSWARYTTYGTVWRHFYRNLKTVTSHAVHAAPCAGRESMSTIHSSRAGMLHLRALCSAAPHGANLRRGRRHGAPNRVSPHTPCDRARCGQTRRRLLTDFEFGLKPGVSDAGRHKYAPAGGLPLERRG